MELSLWDSCCHFDYNEGFEEYCCKMDLDAIYRQIKITFRLALASR